MKVKKIGLFAAEIAVGIVSVVGGGIISYICLNKPDKVEHPCFRSTHRADGRKKVAFDKAWKANLRSLKQRFWYREKCNPYQVGDKYYTGHSKPQEEITIIRYEYINI